MNSTRHSFLKTLGITSAGITEGLPTDLGVSTKKIVSVNRFSNSFVPQAIDVESTEANHASLIDHGKACSEKS